jgi:protein-tyrosine-phosphatase
MTSEKGEPRPIIPAPVRARLKPLVHFLRHAPDRLLHSWRRRRALALLGRYGIPESVLFVCHGNICRSPYAAVAFTQRLPAELGEFVRVASAGFVGPERPSAQEALAVAAERGLDLREHRSQLLTLDGVLNTHLIVVMEPAQQSVICGAYGRHSHHVLVLGDLDPEPIDTRTILDPYARGRDSFELSYSRIDRCLAEMVRVLSDCAGRGASRSVAGERTVDPSPEPQPQ